LKKRKKRKILENFYEEAETDFVEREKRKVKILWTDRKNFEKKSLNSKLHFAKMAQYGFSII